MYKRLALTSLLRHRIFPKQLFATLVAIWLTTVSTAAADTQTTPVRLSINDARKVAIHALRAGDFEIARQLSMGLLLADEHDPHAYSILLQAHSQLGNPKLAKAAARLAYKHSKGKEASFATARNAGALAFSQNRYNAAQYWLRRAANHEPDDRSAQQLAREFKKIRTNNPLNLNISVSTSPSDNINNGTGSATNLVNGIPQLGYINAASRAHSGIVATTVLQLKYRLGQNQNSRTELTTRLYVQNVFLSPEARALLASDPFSPQLENSDLRSTYVDFGINHRFSLGKPNKVATLSSKLGKTWSGGNRSYRFGQVGFSPTFTLSRQTWLKLGTTLEKRWSEISSLNDLTRSQVSATLQYRVKNGDQLSLGINLQDTASDKVNISNQSAVANLSYSFGKPLASVNLSTGVDLPPERSLTLM